MALARKKRCETLFLWERRTYSAGHERKRALTAGKNPWGDNGGDADEALRLPPSAEDASGAGDAQAEGTPQPGKKPHNPWLTPDDDSPLRRSARIDDILRPSGPRRPSFLSSAISASGMLPWVLAATVAAGLLFTSVHVLGENQRGLVTTFGRHTRDVGPGISFTLPWPAEAVQIFDVGTIQVLSLPGTDGSDKDEETLMPTRDGQVINIAFQVRWKISDLSAYAFNLADPQRALRDLADAETRATIAELPFDPVWDGKRRKEVTQRAQQRIQAVLNAWHAGITIEAVEITRADPPSQLTETFQKVTNAENEAAKATRTAEDWSARTINNARVEAQDFDRIYQQYLAAPQITRKRMYYETMERVIGNSDQVVVGGAGGVTLPARPDPAVLAPPAPPAESQPQPQGAQQTKGGQ